MEPGQKEDSGLPLSGVVLLLTILGVIFVQQIPLKPMRPFTPQQGAGPRAYGEQVVPARLWQDPFGAVRNYRAQYAASTTSSIRGEFAIVASAAGDTAKESPPQRESPARLTLILDSAKAGAEQAQAPHDAATLCKSLHRRIEQNSQGAGTEVNSKAAPKAIVLGVMVFGGPYSEPAEIRTRWRYAVLSALDVAGYVPDDAAHIGYFMPDTPAAQTPPVSVVPRLPGVVPFEWFMPIAGGKPPVLVLWIDDAAVGATPLASLARLVRSIDPSQTDCAQGEAIDVASPALSVRILGPAGSTTLKAMIGEAGQPTHAPADKFAEFAIYSASATAADCLLLGEPCDPSRPTSARHQRLAKLFAPLQIKFLRTISADDGLASTVARELCLRQIAPGVAGFLRDCDNLAAVAIPERHPQRASHVVFVAEWDTFYGRSLPATMIREFCRRAQQMLRSATLAPKDVQDLLAGCERSAPRWAHRFSYLRGLDGQTAEPGETPDAHGGNNAQANDQGDAYERERPVGTGQFDYLRRLAGQIERLNQELWEKDQGRIRAIGVLGSDPYDKQLILQALRPQFTNVTFFTTDLDARLLFPGDFRWNRNLIVASSFGLQLHHDLQRHIPPFRDGYQTALYFSGLLALNGTSRQVTQAQLNQWIAPRIFEVSRQGAFDLSMDSKLHGAPLRLEGFDTVEALYPAGSAFFAPQKTREALPWIAVFAALLLVSLSTEIKRAGWRLAHWSRQHYLRAALIVLLAWWFGHFLYASYEVVLVVGRAGEPFSFTNGISAWPSMLLKLLVTVLGAYYLFWMRLALCWNEKGVHRDWVLPTRPRWNFRARWKALRGQSLSRWLDGLRPVARMLPGRLVTAWQDLTIFHWRRREEERTGEVSADTLWLEYLRRGAWPRRLARTFVPFIAYFALCVGIFIISERPSLPIRGLAEYGPQFFFLVTLASFVLMSFVTFVVVDATRLCRRFIELLSAHSIEWSVPTMQSARQRFPAGEEYYLTQWIEIQVIAQRASTVAKFIYYPFILLFMMILARIPYFDAWDMPLGYSITYALLAFYALYCAVILQRAAQHAREHALEVLDGMLIEAYHTGGEKSNVPEEIKLIIQSIKAIRHGAFLPLLQQPVVKVLLLPFGGLGLALLNYLAVLG